MDDRLDHVHALLVSSFCGERQRAGESEQEERQQEGQTAGWFHLVHGGLEK
jgi:hypothetical protein